MSSPPDQQSSRPVNQSLFDIHIRVLVDSYHDFFQERKKIEETYCESLLKLYDKSCRIDAYYDARLVKTTLRSAWSEIRDNLERETQVRRAFLEAISNDIINPLVTLRETQDRIQKRIKEDVHESVYAHTDYAENVLPKLKRSYLKKCQDVEEHKAVAAAAAAHAQPLQVDNSLTLSTSRYSVGVPPKPPPERRSSTSESSAGSLPSNTNTAFSDLAHQGKKPFSSLITFLDKNAAKEPGARSGNDALRSVRAKRDADEADALYRKSVHWLETLRLRREKIVVAGYNSLATFIHESSETLKSVLGKYTDDLTATFSTSLQLYSHIRGHVDSISTVKDMVGVSSIIQHSLVASIPKPIPYYNFFVGECADLIFGFSLIDYATARNLPDGEIPRIVRLCIEEVDKRGLECEGLYRVPGRLTSVIDLMHKIERNERTFSFNPETHDVYAIATLLKIYLRDLPEPLFRFPLQERIQHSIDIQEHIANDFQLLRSKIRRLPSIHRNMLKAVALHLNRVAAHRERNKMDVKNLAIVFWIFGNEEELQKGGDLLSVQAPNDTLMADLIKHAHTLFDDRHHGTSSPPLPPVPAGEPVSPVTYGSSHTKVEVASAEDFAPRVPSQPPHSIHPSSRVNGGNYSNRSSFDVSTTLRQGRQGAISPVATLQYRHSFDFDRLPTSETSVQMTTGHTLYSPEFTHSAYEHDVPASSSLSLSLPSLFQDLGALDREMRNKYEPPESPPKNP